MNEDEGWPVHNNPNDDDSCHMIFEWRSKQACRHCIKRETSLV